jgi:hypothetical protein
MIIPGNWGSERVADKAGFTLIEQVDSYKPPKARDAEAVYQVHRWVLYHEQDLSRPSAP